MKVLHDGLNLFDVDMGDYGYMVNNDSFLLITSLSAERYRKELKPNFIYNSYPASLVMDVVATIEFLEKYAEDNNMVLVRRTYHKEQRLFLI